MKTKIAPLILAMLLAFIGSSANAQPKPDVGAKAYLEFGAYGTLFNTYKRGNLDTWFAERTGDPTRQVDAGSPAFWDFEVGVLFPNPKDTFQFGVGAGLIIPPSHSLWGTQLFFGGRREVVLKPQIISFYTPFKVQLGEAQGFYVTVSPAMLMGWTTGTYTAPGTSLKFTASPGFGFGLSGGMELFFNESLGISFKAGIRFLKTDLVYENPASSTGYSQPLLSNGEKVKVDMGGTYLIAGLVLRLPLKGSSK